MDPPDERPYATDDVEPEWLRDFDADALADGNEHLDDGVGALPKKSKSRAKEDMYEAAIAQRKSVRDYDTMLSRKMSSPLSK
jgi:hypothetical protein